MADRDPVGSLAAKFSIPFALAARLVLGECGRAAFEEPALSDPRIRILARRATVVEDPALTAELPGRRPARVEVRLEDGRTLSHQVDIPSGDFDRPYSRQALRDKFVGLAAPVLGERGAADAWTLCVEGLDRLKGVRELTDALRAWASVSTIGAG